MSRSSIATIHSVYAALIALRVRDDGPLACPIQVHEQADCDIMFAHTGPLDALLTN
jgi:hypothetical protein